MTRPAQTDAIARGTARSWEEWLKFLQREGAAELPHKEIARRIVATGDASGWWAQQITVAYEQHIGRRKPGQRSDGGFEVSVSKTLLMPADAALVVWAEHAAARPDFDGVTIAEGPETTESEKWRYWRCALSDGSRLAVTVGFKAEGKSSLALTHARLESQDAVAHWRAFWKSVLSGLGRK